MRSAHAHTHCTCCCRPIIPLQATSAAPLPCRCLPASPTAPGASFSHLAAAPLLRLCPTGNISGAVAVPPLTRQPDNTWTLTLTPKREEVLTFRMTIDSQTAASQAIVISGRSLSFLALNTSLQQASLVSLGLAATSLITEGALLMVYLEEASYAYVPIVDKAGVRCVAADYGS